MLIGSGIVAVIEDENAAAVGYRDVNDLEKVVAEYIVLGGRIGMGDAATR